MSALVGRVAELDLLERSSVALICAEAGGGKTRLVREFISGRDALVGACLALADLPYAPFTSMLRQLGVETIKSLMSEAAVRELARLWPALGEPPADADRVRLFEYVLTLFERLAPRVLVIEDVHWADRSTRDLLSFLVRNLHGVRLLMTFRSTELPVGSPLRVMVAELTRLPQVTRLDLPPLNRPEVGSLLAGLRGAVTSDEISRVHELSEGNPLFVEALASGDGSSLNDLLLDGFLRLPPSTRSVLQTISADGDAVGHEFLRALTGLDDVALIDALRPAVDANLLVASQDGYVFRHALIRDAVHETQLPAERAALHRRYASVIAESPDLVPNAAMALALHWFFTGDHARAMLSAWDAAAECEASTAYAEQLDLLERLLKLWERVPDAEKLVGQSLLSVTSTAAYAAMMCGDPGRGRPLAKKAFDLARTPEEKGAALNLRAGMRGFDSLESEIEDLLEAERLATAPTRTRAVILARLSGRFLPYGDNERSASFGREGLELARRLGETEIEEDLIVTVANAAAHDGLGDLGPVEEIARTFANPISAVRAHISRSHCYEAVGRSEDAIAAALEGIEAARRLGVLYSIGRPILANHVESLISLGRWDEATERIEQILQRNDVPAMRRDLMIFRGTLWLARGAGPAPDEQIMSTRLDAGEGQLTLPLAGVVIGAHLVNGDHAAASAALSRVLTHPRLTARPCHTWPLLEIATDVPGSVRDEIRAIAARIPAQDPLSAAYAATVAAALNGVDWAPAIEAWEQLRRPYPLAKALFRGACADPRAADERLVKAAAIADQLGAAPLAAAIAARQAPSDLTPREREVLNLLALGRSNRQIADELFISAKTASVHVSNILAKLGVTTRGEAAARARLQR